MNVTGPSPFDVLLFDLGGVLMDFAGFDELGGLLPGSPGRSEVRDLWIHTPAVQSFERGEITSQQFALDVIEDLRIGLSPEEFLVKFVDWAHEPYPGALDLLANLKRRFRIAALSNSNELHTPLHRRRFGSVIDTFFFSDEIGAVKPEGRIYQRVIRDLGAPPDRIVFFDDTPVNVEAARRAGIAAYGVDGLASLKAVLRCLGITDLESG